MAAPIKPKKEILLSCAAVRPVASLPKNILPAVPLLPAVPSQLEMVRVVPSQVSLAEPAKLRVWLPLPRAMVLFALSLSLPAVSLYPVLKPVLKVPDSVVLVKPPSTNVAASGRTSDAPSSKLPGPSQTVPVNVLEPDKVILPAISYAE